MLSGKEYMQGTYSSTTKGYGFVTLEDENKTEVFIEEGNSLNAFTGDIVQLEIIKQAGEKKADEIFDNLRDSDLEIVAELGTAQLVLSDIYHLNVGDVIDIGKSKESEIYLEIGGYRWFTGRMGTYKKNLAVKIDSVCYQAE